MQGDTEKLSMNIATLLILSSLLSATAQNASCADNQVFNSCCNGCGFSFQSKTELTLDNSEEEGEEMEFILLSLFIRMAKNKIDDIKQKEI